MSAPIFSEPAWNFLLTRYTLSMPAPFDLLQKPQTDPTSIYRFRDGLYGVDMLICAISHLDFFSWLAEHPGDFNAICNGLKLQERPTDVMLTLFTAMGLLERKNGAFQLTTLAREHLVRTSPWFIGPYYDSMKERPVCKNLLEVLRTGSPANWGGFKDEKDWARAMEGEAFANQFTAAMDCRATLLAPAMAARVDCSQHRHLLDIGGGSGIYTCAMLAAHRHLRGTVLEKPPVDRITRECIAKRGFAGRVNVTVADMFVDAFPSDCDMHLFSNVLHDWDVPRVKELLKKSFEALPPGGLVVIHDTHINADKTGSLPAAAYSALIMAITVGKCYSEKELADYLHEAGFENVKHTPTIADRSVIVARKSG
ncbi:MAG TPA: methyltransferase [Verrucomicrobiae bacterium]|nr:methyltransferase [Verrucomicrobiae bacterium]